MTDRDDAHPGEFDPVAAAFDLNTNPGFRRDQIVDAATYAKMQAVIEAARELIPAWDQANGNSTQRVYVLMLALNDTLRDLDGG